MIVDGAALARVCDARTAAAVTRLQRQPHLAILTCAPNAATRKFLALKEARAAELGIERTVIDCAAAQSTEQVAARLREALATSDGIIVQLPFPVHIDTDTLLAQIPASRDVDALGPEAVRLLEQDRPLVLPPVVGAIEAIAAHHDFSFAGKRVAVVGEGKLVGRPAAVWCRHRGANVAVVTKETSSVAEVTRGADAIILGAGSPGLLQPDMISEGVAIFDAGTSEEAGKLVGDADPTCAEKASLFTPVPGGIGPLTISLIFSNLLRLAGDKSSM